MSAFSSTRFATFRNNVRNRKVSGWSASGGQCTDYIRRFIQVVLGCKSNTLDWIAGGDARTFFDGMSAKHFRKVRNTANNFPPEGAIVVAEHSSRGSDGKMHNFGHVFTALKGCTPTRLYGFGQNWTKYRLCYEEGHMHYVDTNWRVIGWGIPL